MLNLFQAKRRGRGKGWCPRGSTRRGRIRLSRLERQRPGLYLTSFCNNRSKKLDRFIFGHIFFKVRTTVILFGTLAIEHTPILRLPFEKAWPFDRLLTILSIRTWWFQNPKKCRNSIFGLFCGWVWDSNLRRENWLRYTSTLDTSVTCYL